MFGKLCGLLLLVFCLFLWGCGPLESKTPLSPQDGAKADSRLNGVWYGKADGQPIFLHFQTRNDGTSDFVVVGDESQGGGVDLMPFRMYPSHVQGKDFMNLKPVKELTFFDKNEKTHTGLHDNYWFANYEIANDGSLNIWLVTEGDNLAKAVESGKIRGDIVQNENVTNVVLNDSPENLAKFLTDNKSEKTFLFWGRFKRLDQGYYPQNN